MSISEGDIRIRLRSLDAPLAEEIRDARRSGHCSSPTRHSGSTSNAAAGIVEEGTTNGERMHKARHTAGQRGLDATGNLKAVQRLLGHASIQTTGDIYAD